MGEIRTSANASFRDYVTDGVPASGDHEPIKSEVRTTFGVVEDEITASGLLAANGVRWTTNSIRVRSTGNVVIASALENGDTLNGVTLATGNHVFLGSQTDPKENGIYTVVASGAASRATFADSAAELERIGFFIVAGTVGAGELWTLPLAAADITIGTTNLVFAGLGAPFNLLSLANTWPETQTFSKPLSVQGLTAGKGLLTSVATNAFFGSGTGTSASLTGGDNTGIGANAGAAITTGSENGFFGSGAGQLTTTGLRNIGFGPVALQLNVTGDNCVAVGRAALINSTVSGNTAIGSSAGSAITTGTNNTFIGYTAGITGDQTISVTNTTAIGYGAFTTQDNQISLGNASVTEIRQFGFPWQRSLNALDSMFYGRAAGNLTMTSAACIGIGTTALAALTSGSHNVALGYLAASSGTTIGASVWIGSYAGELAVSVTDTVAIGYKALSKATTGLGAVAVGMLALENALDAGNNTAIGDSALRFTTTGVQNVAIGYTCADQNVTGSYNFYGGQGAAFARTQGDNNVMIGYRAGADAVLCGEKNVGVGAASLLDHTGSGVAALGQEAGRGCTTATNCVFIGHLAGRSTLGQKADADNSIAIGHQAVAAKSNQAVIGNTSVAETVIRGVQRGNAYTVAGLTAVLTAAAAGAGARSFVTDATATTFASIVAGGGANGVPVYSDGTDWRVG